MLPACRPARRCCRQRSPACARRARDPRPPPASYASPQSRQPAANSASRPAASYRYSIALRLTKMAHGTIAQPYHTASARVQGGNEARVRATTSGIGEWSCGTDAPAGEAVACSMESRYARARNFIPTVDFAAPPTSCRYKHGERTDLLRPTACASTHLDRRNL